MGVQTVGNAVVTLTHPAVNAGVATTLTGFKLDDTFFDAVQDMDNSKRIALVGGGSVTITNKVKMGKLTINGLRTQGNAIENKTTGDIILCAQVMQDYSDSTGGTIQISFDGFGKTQTYIYTDVTIVSVPSLKLAGNDLPVFPCVFGYTSFTYKFS